MPTRPPQFVDDKLAGQSTDAANLSALSAAMPVGAAVDSSAKSLIDLLGEILVPNKGSNLPRRLRVTSYSPSADKVMMHGVDRGQPVESDIASFLRLHRGGALQREGPPTEGLSVEALIRRLTDLTGK